MKISFGKVGSTPRDFTYSESGCTIHGTLSKKSRHIVELRSRICGDVDLFCDRCGKEYGEKIDMELTLRLTDTVAEVEDLETIEFLDGEIDMAEILRSETEAIRSDYNYCVECRDADKEIEKEY